MRDEIAVVAEISRSETFARREVSSLCLGRDSRLSDELLPDGLDGLMVEQIVGD